MSEYLPQELLIKILTWLPPKTLIRFKCVSKTWNSLISSPYFISIHTQHQTLFAKPQIILRRYLRPLHLERFSLHREFDGEALQEDNVIEYPFRDLTRLYFRIVGSCNGVLCLSDDLFGMPGSVLLWNPSIKRKVVLPEVNMDGYWHVRVLGFGYDAEHNDYKVVKLSYEVNMDGYSGPPEAEVFLLSTKNWHKIDSRQVPEKCMLEYFWSQVVLNGNIHWLAFQKIQNNERQAKVENSIMLFDLSREVFDEIDLPETLKNELPIDLSTLNVEGSLAVVHYSGNSAWDRSCEIWVMKKYRDERSWSKDYNVKFERGPGLVLGIGKMGQVILAIDNFGLVPYDPVTEKSAGLCVFGTRGSFYAGGYVESLALLDNGERAEALVLSDSEDERKFCEDYQDVERLEVQKRSSVSQYLTTLLRRY